MRNERSATREAASTAADRFMFFSDAVLVIALTLLALDLPQPSGSTGPAFLASLADRFDAYLAFLVSFLVVAQQWRGHHGLFRYLVDAPQRLIVANTVWLLTIVLTTFATTALSILRLGAINAQDGLLSAGAPADLLARNRGRGLVLAAIFLVSIGFAFLVGVWAFVLRGALPVVKQQVLHRVRHHAEVSAA